MIYVLPRTGVEYGDFQITVYRSCYYQCRYCWAWNIPLMSKRISRGKYDPVREAVKLSMVSKPSKIVVSFTSDPYQPVEKEKQLTRRVLKVLSNSKHTILILTKNPKLAVERDIDILRKGRFWLGTTITSLEKTSWEPNAPHPRTRLEALKKAHSEGIRTWISIEPIIPFITYPEKIVAETVSYVDWYVLGSLNYVPQLKLPFTREDVVKWCRKHVPLAIRYLKKLNKEFLIKKELREIIF